MFFKVLCTRRKWKIHTIATELSLKPLLFCFCTFQNKWSSSLFSEHHRDIDFNTIIIHVIQFQALILTLGVVSHGGCQVSYWVPVQDWGFLYFAHKSNTSKLPSDFQTPQKFRPNWLLTLGRIIIKPYPVPSYYWDKIFLKAIMRDSLMLCRIFQSLYIYKTYTISCFSFIGRIVYINISCYSESGIKKNMNIIIFNNYILYF